MKTETVKIDSMKAEAIKLEKSHIDLLQGGDANFTDEYDRLQKEQAEYKTKY